MINNKDNWRKIRGGKYTRFNVEYSHPNNKYIENLPICKCGLPCDIRKNEENNYLYFRCAKKNMWPEMKEEFDILGVPYEGRIPKTEEFIKILKNLWSENPDPFEGEFYTFKNVSFQPKPLQDKLQIWMGGNADGAIQRAVEYADGWQPIWFSPEELQNKILFLEKYADEKKVNINREIYNISLRNRILITGDKDNGNNPDTALIGQKNEVFDKILAYRDLRIKEVVLDFISPNIDEILETMEIVGKELIPEL